MLHISSHEPKDIVVTTPKSEIENSAAEAESCISSGGGYYFRRFSSKPKGLAVGSKIFYSENGYVTGYAVVEKIVDGPMFCELTKRQYPEGTFAVMPASSWKWIEPIPMKGFQGFRYFNSDHKVVGDWKDKKPNGEQP